MQWGNHETDLKARQLQNRIRESEFAYLNSNIPTYEVDDLGKLPQFVIKKIGHKKVAFVGGVTEDPDK